MRIVRLIYGDGSKLNLLACITAGFNLEFPGSIRHNAGGAITSHDKLAVKCTV
jgi:hypothetical protein